MLTAQAPHKIVIITERVRVYFAFLTSTRGKSIFIITTILLVFFAKCTRL